ncbi:MAG: bifunctional oligoribonuclease/PAP phosphatase NrnA [Mariprofundaceae bacterium]
MNSDNRDNNTGHLNELCDAIQEARGILLTTHCSPDGDGIGSQIAFYHALQATGKSVFMHNRDGVPRIYHFLEGSDQVGAGDVFDAGDVDLIISLDAGSKARLGFAELFFAGRKLAVIDHHVTNDCFGDINLIDISACATGAIVYDLMRQLDLPVSAASARALYVTLLTDTSCFRNENTTAEVHEMVVELIRAGADPWPIARDVYENRSEASFHLQMRCMQTLKRHDDGRSAWLYIDADIYRETGSDGEDSEGLIDLARGLTGVEIAVFMRPGDDTSSWKVTFRGKYDADVGALAVSLGGGGHRYAAGCTMVGGFEEIRHTVAQAVTKLLD